MESHDYVVLPLNNRQALNGHKRSFFIGLMIELNLLIQNVFGLPTTAFSASYPRRS